MINDKTNGTILPKEKTNRKSKNPKSKPALSSLTHEPNASLPNKLQNFSFLINLRTTIILRLNIKKKKKTKTKTKNQSSFHYHSDTQFLELSENGISHFFGETFLQHYRDFLDQFLGLLQPQIREISHLLYDFDLRCCVVLLQLQI